MPTDSELKEAAERLRSIVPDERMWDDPAAQWGDMDKDLWVCAFAYVRHILAQRADDGELIDAAFLESVGFIKCCTSRANPALDVQGFEDWMITFDSGDGVDLRIYNDRGLTADCWINNAGLSAGPQTRGQLRQLLSALGISTGGGEG